jgi:hypothetical protein
MFVERDTGAKRYFEIPLERVLRIYLDVIRGMSGLSHTLRGPVMSASPGKVMLEGVVEISGKKYFTLKLLQSRDKYLTGNVFFAEYDEKACWWDELKLVTL